MTTILIIDDLAIFREPIQLVLRQAGFKTLTASSGLEAISILSSQVPDLVLLDLGMTPVDGIKVLSHMRSSTRHKGTPVLILSGNTDRMQIIEAARLGISGYILKTKFSVGELLQRIEGISNLKSPASGVAAATMQPAFKPGAKAPASKPAPSLSAALESLTPLLTPDATLRLIERCQDLQGLSPAVTQVIKLTGSPHCSGDALAKAIGQDQAIAIKVLKLANSSVYTRGKPVSSLQEAVVRIGLDCIRQTVLNLCVVDRFKAVAFDEQLDTRQFWEHSIGTGIVAAELAHAQSEKEADAAFTAGLMHDVGRIVLAEQLGQKYVQVVAAARTLMLPLEQVESRMLGADHAEVVDRFLPRWHFPKELIKAIRLHHGSYGSTKADANSAHIPLMRIALANRLAHALLLGTSGNDTIYPTEDLCEAIAIPAQTIQRIEETSRQQTDDMKLVMLSQAAGGMWPSRVEQLRAQLTAPFRPVCVGLRPAFDAVRIFCSQLAGPLEDSPNVCVVHVAAQHDAADIKAALRDAESGAGVKNLPLVIISPTGSVSAEDIGAPGRRARKLSIPFAIPRFIEAVNALAAPAQLKAAA